MQKFDFDSAGLDDYMTDSTLESEVGVVVVFPRGRKFRILRAGGSNQRFNRAFQAAIRPHRRAMERGTMDLEESQEIMRRVYAKYVVIDWEGIRDSEGKEIPYSVQAAELFFEAFPNLFDDLVRLATEMSLFSEKTIEEAKQALGEA